MRFCVTGPSTREVTWMSDKKPKPELLLQCELAELLRISERTVARMRAEGVGPCYHKARGRILYPRPLVDDWIAQHTVTPVRNLS